MANILFKKLLDLQRAVVEEWKDIVGYEGMYQVSNLGRVRSLDRIVYRNDIHPIQLHGRILSPGANHGQNGGYLFVQLRKDGASHMEYIHRLVATAFIPNPSGYSVINHKDKDVQNNIVGNLEWCSVSYNISYDGATELRAIQIRKPVLVYNPDGSFLGEFPSCAEVASYLGIWKDTVYRNLSGKHKNQRGFTFRYK